jgi:hemolysin activation/secretion protein
LHHLDWFSLHFNFSVFHLLPCPAFFSSAAPAPARFSTGRVGGAWLLTGLLVSAAGLAQAAPPSETQTGTAPGDPTQSAAVAPGAAQGPKKAFFINEYRVKGAHVLTPLEIETAVYSFLGPERTEDDVKAACAALEKVYRDKGYSAASVQYAAQVGKGGVIFLQVLEGTVARLRVKGSRYFSPAKIKAAAPSVAEGKPLDFNAVSQDMVALNQLPDRNVTPSLKPGVEPGTYDVDLTVKDSAPVHGSVEVDNHASPNTKPLRVNLSVSDTNLWQAGHVVGMSLQLAPQRRQDSEVLTGYYLARFAGLEHTSFMLQGTKQDSNISTLGGTTVAGPGQTLEARTTLTLPNGKNWSTGKDWENFYHSISFAIDYKHYKQTVNSPGSTDTSGTGRIVTPITYFPFSVDYTATAMNLTGKGSATDFNASVIFNLRGLGSGPKEFGLNRSGADGNFVTFRSDLSHTQELPMGMQVFGKIQGQLANQPLVSSEEFSGGGQSTVRGYLEAETVGDNGAFATLELRSPSLFSVWKKKTETHAPAEKSDAKPAETSKIGEWRIYVFGDVGGLTLYDSLPGQQARYSLSSFGAGTSLSLGDHFSGTLDAGYPLNNQAHTKAHDLHLTFRASLNY